MSTAQYSVWTDCTSACTKKSLHFEGWERKRSKCIYNKETLRPCMLSPFDLFYKLKQIDHYMQLIHRSMSLTFKTDLDLGQGQYEFFILSCYGEHLNQVFFHYWISKGFTEPTHYYRYGWTNQPTCLCDSSCCGRGIKQEHHMRYQHSSVGGYHST